MQRPTRGVLRVLHVIDSLEPAGAEVSLGAMLRPLADRGIEGSVVHFGKASALHHELEASGVSVTALTATTRLGRVIGTTKIIRSQRPDLVHTTLFEADLAGRIAAFLTRTPVVTSLVNTGYDVQAWRSVLGQPGWLNRVKMRCALALDVLTARTAVGFHAITHAAAVSAAEHLRTGGKPIVVISRGRSASTLGLRTLERRDAARQSLLSPADAVVVLAVARQEPQKSLDTLLDATAALISDHPSLLVVVAGREGRSTVTLQRQAHELGLADRVVWLGARSDVPDLMCAADVLVLPSRWEGLGGVLIEAMALELPIVASDIPAIAETAPRNEIAILVSPGSPAELAAGITEAITDSSAAAARTRRGRERFERLYEIGAVADQMAEFYRSVGISR
jgi:glycosyltransferase involved in cell wall biosynthesis